MQLLSGIEIQKKPHCKNEAFDLVAEVHQRSTGWNNSPPKAARWNRICVTLQQANF